MIKLSVSIFLLYFLLPLQAEKRNWYYGTGLDGKAKEFFGTTDMHSRFLKTPARGQTYWETRLSKVNSELEAMGSKIKNSSPGPEKNQLIDDRYKLINNKARCLIYLQKVDQALTVLKKLEKVWPGESIVAENLATCFDLKGEYAKAETWISIATERNSMSAYSNLWVYKKVITARKEYAKNKDYLKESSVSGLSISQKPTLEALDLSKIENFQKRWSLAGTAKHIREQLKTQLQLRDTPTDPILAHLMEELACIYAVNEVCEVALPIFELAKKHGHPENEIINGRIQQMKTLIAANNRTMDYSRSIFEKISKGAWILYSTIIFLCLLLSYVWFTGKKKSVDS